MPRRAFLDAAGLVFAIIIPFYDLGVAVLIVAAFTLYLWLASLAEED